MRSETCDRLRRWVATALAAGFVLTGRVAGAQEMAAFGVNLFGDDANECGYALHFDFTTNELLYLDAPAPTGTRIYLGEGPSDLAYCDDWVDIMEDAFDDEGWNQTENRTNAEVDGRDWSDDSKVSYGDDDVDPFGTDFAEVTMLCSHGGSTTNASDGYRSFFTMGDDDAGEACKPATDWHMLFGDNSGGDAEVVIIGTCESAQWAVWNNTGYFHLRERDGSFNTWLGFHGISYDSSTDTNRFEDYVVDSFHNGLGDNFLDEMHRNPWGADNEQCPVAVIFCETTNDCDTQYEWGGFEDRHKVASSDLKSTSRIFYIEGCDPADGIAMP